MEINLRSRRLLAAVMSIVLPFAGDYAAADDREKADQLFQKDSARSVFDDRAAVSQPLYDPGKYYNKDAASRQASSFGSVVSGEDEGKEDFIVGTIRTPETGAAMRESDADSGEADLNGEEEESADDSFEEAEEE